MKYEFKLKKKVIYIQKKYFFQLEIRSNLKIIFSKIRFFFHFKLFLFLLGLIFVQYFGMNSIKLEYFSSIKSESNKKDFKLN